MTSFVRRIFDLLRASLNSLIDRAEDPEKMLDQMMRDMQQSYDRSKVEVARVLAEKHRLQAHALKAEKEAVDWERKAVVAIKAGDEALARKALERKRSHAEIAEGFRKQFDEQTQAAERLKEALRALENKMAEARVKRTLLTARHQRALAHQKIHRALSAAGSTTAFDNLARLESRVQDLEADALAHVELDEGTLEGKFRQLGAAIDVEDDLLLLKARIAEGDRTLPSAEPGALPPGP